jgi:protein gp37
MGDKTGIGWTDATWNPVRGCSRVSEGCRNCYAEQQAARIVRMGKGKPTAYDGLVKLVNGEERWTGVVRMVPERLADPLRWRAPRRVFVNSMSDLFHPSLTNDQISAVFGVMAAAPQHTFQVLTKRAQRMREWFDWAEKQGDEQDLMRLGRSALLTCAWEVCAGEVWGDADDPFDGDLPTADRFGTTWPLPNVWLGVSVENQEAADERIPDLLRTPAAVRFLSCEPLLAAVDLRHVQHNREFEVDALTGDHGVHRPLAGRGPRIDWVIDGCESGKGARPAEVAWFEAIAEQCRAAGVPLFVKQMMVDGVLRTDPAYFPPRLRHQEFPR